MTRERWERGATVTLANPTKQNFLSSSSMVFLSFSILLAWSSSHIWVASWACQRDGRGGGSDAPRLIHNGYYSRLTDSRGTSVPFAAPSACQAPRWWPLHEGPRFLQASSRQLPPQSANEPIFHQPLVCKPSTQANHAQQVVPHHRGPVHNKDPQLALNFKLKPGLPPHVPAHALPLVIPAMEYHDAGQFGRQVWMLSKRRKGPAGASKAAGDHAEPRGLLLRPQSCKANGPDLTRSTSVFLMKPS